MSWKTETNAEYHAHKDIYSSTLLKMIIQHSPAYFKACIDGYFKRPETSALQVGTLIHMALLEGEQFMQRYAMIPSFGDYRIKANREKRDSWMRDNEGKVFVTEGDLQMIQGIYKSVMGRRDVRNMFSGCEFEKSGYFTDISTGLPLRIRPDAYDKHRRILIDVKSVKSIKREHFPYSIRDYRWDMSMAHYAQGITAIEGEAPDACVFIAVEKTYPYQVAVYELGEASLERGRQDCDVALKTIASCLEKNEWPPYQQTHEVIDLPERFLKGGSDV